MYRKLEKIRDLRDGENMAPKIFWELIKKQEIKSFQELKDQYGLGNPDLFRYFQMRHYLGETIKRGKTEIILLFISAY